MLSVQISHSELILWETSVPCSRMQGGGEGKDEEHLISDTV